MSQENYDLTKETLIRGGISVVAEEPVSEYEKIMVLDGTGKIVVSHLEQIETYAYALVNRTKLYLLTETSSLKPENVLSSISM